jgi:hypothetical protein
MCSFFYKKICNQCVENLKDIINSNGLLNFCVTSYNNLFSQCVEMIL